MNLITTTKFLESAIAIWTPPERGKEWILPVLHDALCAHELLRLCRIFVPKPDVYDMGDDAPESVRETAEAVRKFWEGQA